MKQVLAIRVTEVRYSGRLDDYSLEDLRAMAWAKMDDHGDFSPDSEEELTDENKHRDGEVWIENHLPCNHLVYVGMAYIEEFEEEAN